uniref:Uncharacterized protein n=1 Tax=Panagrolaimus sp. ES5 TaxID=591445 RepID=A0AC34GKN2_9BILA
MLFGNTINMCDESNATARGALSPSDDQKAEAVVSELYLDGVLES